MVEVDPPPLDASGTLHVSDELASLLAPYLNGRDNIAVRFIGQGLPTTATAVISEMYVKIAEPIPSLRWYAMRAMIFGTPTGKTGVNVYFKPIRMEIVDLEVGQAIQSGPVYNFREVYDDIEQSSEDMERLLHLADDAFTNGMPQDTQRNSPGAVEVKPSWWRKLFQFSL